MSMLRSLSTIGLVLLGLGSAAATHAATLYPGDLLKLSSRPDVYYFGTDGKRYVFPNEKTYFTWYTGFSTKLVSDAELAAVSVGGAVTYRPGAKLVKVTTDPKVYAVSHGGTLRWIETEQLAAGLYGPDWSTKVDDLPDAFFATYKVGSPISKLTDYVPSAELAQHPTIAADKQALPSSSTSTNPTPTSTTATVSLNVSKTTAQAGDLLTLIGQSAHPSGIAKIELFFDSVLIKTCTSSLSCSGETQIPLSGTKTSYEAKVVSTALDTSVQTDTRTVTIDGQTSNLVTLTIGRSVIKTGQAAEVIVESDASIAAIRTDIYIDGSSIEACASSIRRCAWSDFLPGAVGTVYDVYGKVTDNLGRVYLTAHKTITIGTNDSPAVAILSGKSVIYVNETVDVTVTGSDDNGIATIDILKDESVLKTCTGASTCTVITGPWPNVGNLSFAGRVTDGLGLVSTSDPIVVTVTHPQ
jgi:hypothetical protein